MALLRLSLELIKRDTDDMLLNSVVMIQSKAPLIFLSRQVGGSPFSPLR